MKIGTSLLVLLLFAPVTFVRASLVDVPKQGSNPIFSLSTRSLKDTLSDFDPYSVSEPIVFTQEAPQRKVSKPITKFIIPTLCIAYGTAARFNDTPIRQFDKHIAGRVDEHITRHHGIDNVFQVTPAVLAYGLDFIPGIESRNNFRDRTLIFTTSYLFMGGVVFLMKSEIDVIRPRGWWDDAFPSGHTSIAFTGAHLLYKEYKDVSPWIGVGGYAVATATGVFRVLNRAHWVSDVVAGAGIGILSAEVGYMMLPVWHRLFGIESSRQSMVIVPSINTRSVGLGMVYVF